MNADRAFMAAHYGIAKHLLQECEVIQGETFQFGYVRSLFYYSRYAKLNPVGYKNRVGKQQWDDITGDSSLGGFLSNVVEYYENEDFEDFYENLFDYVVEEAISYEANDLSIRNEKWQQRKFSNFERISWD